MNDFSDLEKELKRLRPVPPSRDLLARLENAMAEPEAGTESPEKVIRPLRFRIGWVLGAGLAAAAVVLLLLRVNFEPNNKGGTSSSRPTSQPRGSVSSSIAEQSPKPLPERANEFIASDATQVVYDKEDQGLLFPNEGEQPVRRIRWRTHETLCWQNPATGASLRVSYPGERVELVPVSGQ